MTSRKTPDAWRELQQCVADVFAADGYAVEVDKSIKTARSAVNFDVYAEKFGERLKPGATCAGCR